MIKKEDYLMPLTTYQMKLYKLIIDSKLSLEEFDDLLDFVDYLKTKTENSYNDYSKRCEK